MNLLGKFTDVLSSNAIVVVETVDGARQRVNRSVSGKISGEKCTR